MPEASGARRYVAQQRNGPCGRIRTTGLDRLRESVRTCGFGSLPHALAPATLARLQREAEERLGLAVFAQRQSDLRYRANIVSLGPAAAGLLGGQEARDLLFAVFGERLELAETVSCLTFYGEGDHLGPHIDQPASQCAVTVLVDLAASGAASPPSPTTGLALHVYGEQKPQGEAARLVIPTRSGTIVVGRGSRIWHERPPLLRGERVVAITGCFRMSGATPGMNPAHR